MTFRTTKSADLPGPWMDRAACAPHPMDWWFPDSEAFHSYARGKAICGVCPVQAECREFALSTEQPFGLWGSLTPQDRRRLLR